MKLKIDGILFRKVHDKDLPFLQKVYRSTREQELDLTPWSELEKSQFISQQFSAQHRFYQEQFDSAFFLIILIREEPAGRLYLDERKEEIRIIDIAFLPGFRGMGWGTKILNKIISLAGENGKGVGIHVEKNNPARSLYLRLGFENTEDKGIYQFMMWLPERKNNN